MLKLILGLKGSGKTKALIEMVNDASHASHGSVVCIEKGQKLIYDVKYKARLVEADAYEIDDAHALFGFIAGIAASDRIRRISISTVIGLRFMVFISYKFISSQAQASTS